MYDCKLKIYLCTKGIKPSNFPSLSFPPFSLCTISKITAVVMTHHALLRQKPFCFCFNTFLFALERYEIELKRSNKGLEDGSGLNQSIATMLLFSLFLCQLHSEAHLQRGMQAHEPWPFSRWL